MQRVERVTLFFIVAVVINLITWSFAHIVSTLKLTITSVTLLVLLLSVFWRTFRSIFSRHWQEVLSSLLLLVTLLFFSIKFATFLLPGTLIIFISVAIAILLSTKYISSWSKKQAKTLIFSDDFLDHTHWRINQWGSNCCSWSDAQMRFTGPVTGDPAVRKGEDGSHRDLTNKLELEHTYEVTCYVKATPGITAQFRLWCHDKIRSGISTGTNKSTDFKTPGPRGEFVSLRFTPNHNTDIRIHLQYKPGKGTIYVDNVRIHQIS